MEEYEWEEMADMAIIELREFISTEQQLVQEGHSLMDKLNSWDYLFAHLDERIPEKSTTLHALSGEIMQQLVSIRTFAEAELNAELTIIKEEEATLKKLEKGRAHREWQIVKSAISEEIKEEEKSVRLTKEEIKTLHSMFIDLMKIIKRSAAITLKDEHITQQKDKEEFAQIELHYYAEIYKFSRAYERILRQLWEKERALLGEIKKKLK